MIAVRNSNENLPAAENTTNPEATLVINQGKDVLRDTLCQMLHAASDQSDGKIRALLASLAVQLENNKKHTYLSENEKNIF